MGAPPPPFSPPPPPPPPLAPTEGTTTTTSPDFVEGTHTGQGQARPLTANDTAEMLFKALLQNAFVIFSELADLALGVNGQRGARMQRLASHVQVCVSFSLSMEIDDL